MAAKLNGKWKMKNSENFDEYMKALGVGLALRKLGNIAKPVLTIEIKGSAIKMKSVSTAKTVNSECTLDQEWDEETADGRKCKSIMTMEGDKLVQRQKWEGKESILTRYVDGDDLLQIECVLGNIVSKRTYERAEK
ncbi:fatty acid-binding protein, liver-like [Clavelina lepadiformis]|uniref:fatty acid-binding protein, liver-like n=1 Tax=Clavelina lepadiformis TaxID=159417 RepID=UPI004041AE39